MAELPFQTVDLGQMAYGEALAVQRHHLEEVLAARESGAPEIGRVLLVEHPPVITISARPDAARHLVADPSTLQAKGVRVEQTDRGGDITYHGPGQLVVYPILDLNTLGLRLHDYMRLLESATIDVCRQWGVSAVRDPVATGVWITKGETDETPHAKVCAMGVRVRKWISMHGLALNVTTDLSHFQLIVPCGLVGRPVTSLQDVLGDRCPAMGDVKQAMCASLGRHIRDRINVIDLRGREGSGD
ncbi:MAG: lipoyl(octanoyl) transferase LipB [Phycisphaeraceae bacterium]|nr:lipoyl(octanoyl) transferase LipB [Phycisphaeraceae bacterium]MBX3367766.1 lipoyl(octanoyl) transferase LipB [Phycisphaeraceae bacterium]